MVAPLTEAGGDGVEVLLGEKVIAKYGCTGCHDVPGFEGAGPIGTELTNWGSKTVDKLDFAFMPEILAEEHGWSYHEKTEYKEYRENFIEPGFSR